MKLPIKPWSGIPKCNRKVGRPNPPGSQTLQKNLKKKINKTPRETLTDAATFK